MTTTPHPWLLTGPWYRWTSPGVPEAGRGSKPEIQKYVGFDFAGDFVREPQRSLIWMDEDYFHRTIHNPNKPEPEPGKPAEPGTWLREKTQIRKLYKPNHARNYLVVAELHCDMPGLPRVARSEVAEAGFAVRRLRVHGNKAELDAAMSALSEAAGAREQLAYLERNAKGRIKAASGLLLLRQLERPVVKKQHQLLERWAAGKLALDELAAAGAIGLETEAWIPDPLDPLRGRWQALSDATPRLVLGGEATFGLYPLIPDPRVGNHSAAARTMYFGAVPTGAREAEADGTPRFDEHHLYEIRCFVRRHPPADKPHCPGELVWSAPTLGYRIASELDPEGTANMPISITVPSMRDLQALADSIATGGAGGMRIVQPPDSVMPLKGIFPDASAGSSGGIGQVCFIAFILLFYIALFLVFVFLPIIVFLFGLFFLLRLKFCIPPALSIDLHLAGALKTQLDPQFEVGGSFDFSADELTGAGITDLASLSNWVDTQLEAVFGAPLPARLKSAPLNTRLQRLLDLRTDFRGSIDAELAEQLNLSGWGPAAPADSPLAPPLVSGSGKLKYYEVIDPRGVLA